MVLTPLWPESRRCSPGLGSVPGVARVEVVVIGAGPGGLAVAAALQARGLAAARAGPQPERRQLVAHALRPAAPPHPAAMVRAAGSPHPSPLRALGRARRPRALPRGVRRPPPAPPAPRLCRHPGRPRRPGGRPLGRRARGRHDGRGSATSSSPRATATPRWSRTGRGSGSSRGRWSSPRSTATAAPMPAATCSSSVPATPGPRSRRTWPSMVRPASGSPSAPLRTSSPGPVSACRRRRPASSCAACRPGSSTGWAGCSPRSRNRTSRRTGCRDPPTTCTPGRSSAGCPCRTSVSSKRSARGGSSRSRRSTPSTARRWSSRTARRLRPDAVILATGYRARLEPLVGHLGVLGPRGLPVANGAEQTARGARPLVHGLPHPDLRDVARAADRRHAHRGRDQPGRRSVSNVKRCSRSRSTNGIPMAVAGVSTPAACGSRAPSCARARAACPSMMAVP